PPSLIKMDVEGAEGEVLAGAKRMLRADRPVIFVALHGPEPRRACKALLAEAGYAIHDLRGNRITGDPEGDEIYALPPRWNAVEEHFRHWR
ncbi:MAG TPA: FkbM family methyltransferase, partial [Pseudomonadota bacterium]|nr:FkbM family methyltransferase [Pseudomonadota bacterium]